MRTIVDFPNDLLEKLARYCRSESVSRAEAVRRAVSRFVDEFEARPQTETAFGLWSDRKARDALEIEDTLREEWR